MILERYNTIFRGQSSPFPTAGLDTLHYMVNDGVFLEKERSADAQILPSVASLGSGDDYLVLPETYQLSANRSLIWKQKFNGNSSGDASIFGFGQNSKDYMRFYLYDGAFNFERYRAAQLFTDTNFDGASWGGGETIQMFIRTWYKFEVKNLGSGDWEFFINDISQGVSSTSNNFIQFDRLFQKNSNLYYKADVAYIKLVDNITGDDVFNYPLSGKGKYEYDVVSGKSATWSQTTLTQKYDENGSLYPLSNGWSKFVKSGEPDEQVPYGNDGNPMNPTVLSTYSNSRNYAGSSINLNMADCMLDMPEEKEDVFMDNIYKLNISENPDFDGQYGFDILADTASSPNSIKTDLYVGLNGSWNLLKEMTFECDDLSVSSPTSLVRAVESDDNIGLAWTSQRTTGYLGRITSKEFVSKYNEVRTKITARKSSELKLSNYATLQAAIEALNLSGSGSQLNIDESKTLASSDNPPTITANDVVVYSDNQSVITLGANNTGSHPFYFTGDNVHIMGVSVDINRANQTLTFHGVYHDGCDEFSVIGCDVRNSNGYNFECTNGASNGIYGACVGLVSGDDCFTAVLASSNITMEFCVGGCSNNTFGSSRAFEYEDGDTFCTFYKNIAFGMIGWGAIDLHIHAGAPSATNILFEECLSLYNSFSYTWTGRNLTDGTISDSNILNCRDVNSFYDNMRFFNVKDSTIQGNHTKSIKVLTGASNLSVLQNKEIEIINVQAGSLHDINFNNLVPSVNSGIGVYLKDVDNSNVLNNKFITEYSTSPVAIRIEDSDNNTISNNSMNSRIPKGILFLGTSDGNSGTGNNLDYANVDIDDQSSGNNSITGNDSDQWNPRDDGNFNRANSLHTATAKTGYYISEFPNKWHITELADPAIYDTFFETAYQDRIFGKIVINGSDIIRLDEFISYSVKQVTTLPKILRYCRITDIYP